MMKKLMFIMLAFMLTCSSYASSHKGKRVPMRRSVQSAFAGLTPKRSVQKIPFSIYQDGENIEVELDEDMVFAIMTFKNQDGDILKTILLSNSISDLEIPENASSMEMFIGGSLYIGDLF